MKVFFKFYKFRKGSSDAECLKKVEEFEGTIDEINKKIDNYCNDYSVDHPLPIVDGIEITLS